MKKVIYLILVVLIFIGCQKAIKESDLCDEFSSLPKDNHLSYVEEGRVEAFLEHGTGAIVVGDAKRETMEEDILRIEEALAKSNLSSYYIDIDRNSKDADSLHFKMVISTTLQSITPVLVLVEEGRLTGIYTFGREMETDVENEMLEKMKAIKQKQDSLKEQGCDDGCSLKGN